MSQEPGYFETDVPSGDGLCSDNDCPCPETVIPRGEGYLYITQELVDFRRVYPGEEDATRVMRTFLERGNDKFNADLREDGVVSTGFFRTGPILICQLAARLRNLNLEVAAADARHWWMTGRIPLRLTPLVDSATVETKATTGHSVEAYTAFTMQGLVDAGKLLIGVKTQSELGPALRAAADRLTHVPAYKPLAAEFLTMAEQARLYSDEEARVTALHFAKGLLDAIDGMGALLQRLQEIRRKAPKP